jgi:hypothetical protein
MQFHQDGTNKRTMGSARAHNYRCHTSQGPSKPKTSRGTRGFGWHPLDFENRSTLERSSAPISAISDLSSEVPALGTTRSIPTHCSGAGPGPVRTRWPGHPRSLYRRDFCSGKKRCLAVGKAKPGKSFVGRCSLHSVTISRRQQRENWALANTSR